MAVGNKASASVDPCRGDSVHCAPDTVGLFRRDVRRMEQWVVLAVKSCAKDAPASMASNFAELSSATHWVLPPAADGSELGPDSARSAGMGHPLVCTPCDSIVQHEENVAAAVSPRTGCPWIRGRGCARCTWHLIHFVSSGAGAPDAVPAVLFIRSIAMSTRCSDGSRSRFRCCEVRASCKAERESQARQVCVQWRQQRTICARRCARSTTVSSASASRQRFLFILFWDSERKLGSENNSTA